MACILACPGQVFDTHRPVRVSLAGHDVEWADIDTQKCDVAFRGAELGDQPQADSYFKERPNSRPGNWSPFSHKPSNVYNTGQAVCGARGCTRACMIAMEARGVVDNKFEKPFRRRPTWKVDWEQIAKDSPVEAPAAAPAAPKEPVKFEAD